MLYAMDSAQICLIFIFQTTTPFFFIIISILWVSRCKQDRLRSGLYFFTLKCLNSEQVWFVFLPKISGRAPRLWFPHVGIRVQFFSNWGVILFQPHVIVQSSVRVINDLLIRNVRFTSSKQYLGLLPTLKVCQSSVQELVRSISDQEGVVIAFTVNGQNFGPFTANG